MRRFVHWMWSIACWVIAGCARVPDYVVGKLVTVTKMHQADLEIISDPGNTYTVYDLMPT